MKKMNDLEKRVNRIRESIPPLQAPEEIIVGFINQLPAELRNAIIAYGREQVKLE